MTVPVVGALLIFTLMIGPPAAARCFSDRPGLALLGSVAIALVTVWAAIASAYEMNWPVGFFVGTFSAAWYGEHPNPWDRSPGGPSGTESRQPPPS
jgi:zinc/manganese transport system permease protein